MNRTEIAKKALRVAVQTGSGKIIHTLIKNNVPTDTTLDKVTVATASFALGGVVAESAANYMDRIVDEVVTAYNSIRNNDTL